MYRNSKTLPRLAKLTMDTKLVLNAKANSILKNLAEWMEKEGAAIYYSENPARIEHKGVWRKAVSGVRKHDAFITCHDDYKKKIATNTGTGFYTGDCGSSVLDDRLREERRQELFATVSPFIVKCSSSIESRELVHIVTLNLFFTFSCSVLFTCLNSTKQTTKQRNRWVSLPPM